MKNKTTPTYEAIHINGQEIRIYPDRSEKMVAIKPICLALGIDYPSQFTKIKNDDILSSVIGLSTIPAADSKNYQTAVLPFEFVFGWLFSINPKNVKESSREDMLKYRKECYFALKEHFTRRYSILKQKGEKQLEIKRLEKELESDERYARIKELKQEIKLDSEQLNTLDKKTIAQTTLFE